MSEPHDFINEPHRKPVVDWLLSKGFIRDTFVLAIAWSDRGGHDFTDLEFYPLARHADDLGWEAIIGHHASGSNPRLAIGTCEHLADVQMVYETIRRINGYLTADAEQAERDARPKTSAPVKDQAP